MTEWILLPVIIWMNGVVELGSDVDGWSPRAHETREACAERMMFARTVQLPPDMRDIIWMCIPREIDGRET